MYAADIRFLAGRYHATGWNHHVNEGTVEWPPSPLRLLRGLAATGFKLGWDEDRIARAVLALTGLPVYAVPPATAGHTRHYMPIRNTTTLVFDAFYAFSPGEGPNAGDSLGVEWPDATPDPKVREDLDALFMSMTYLGRAESWVECHPRDASIAVNARPGTGGAETVSLPMLETQEAIDTLSAAHPLGRGKRSVYLPRSPWEVVSIDTGAMQKSGWSRPPGVREVPYALRDPALRVPHRADSARVEAPVTHMLFAVSSRVPPDVGRTVSVADRLRRAAMSWSRRDAGDADPLLSGKDENGLPLIGNRHAYWLPFSIGGDQTLDHVLLYVPEGLSRRTADAVARVRKVWGDAGHDLRIAYIGDGDSAQLGATALVGPSRFWVTDTPFVPFRHPKRGKDGVEDQVRRALGQSFPHGHPEVTVEPFQQPSHGLKWYEIQTQRRGGGSKGLQRGFGVRLEFAEPVLGPIALGYGAHFGLGRFRSLV